MSIRENHEQAMLLAEEGFVAKRRGKKQEAHAKLQQALYYERLAAQALIENLQAEPTRSVLYRSAASLALMCEEYREAERLIATALCGNPPEEITQELRQLLQQVYHQLAKTSVNDLVEA